MKKLIILAAAASVAVAIATVHAAPPDKTAPKPPARVWWILDFGSGKCIQASKAAGGTMPSSPEAMHKMLRSEAIADTVEVKKDDDGQIVFVRIGVPKNGDETSLFWFPGEESCARGLDVAKSKGLINDDDDLK